MFGRPSDGKLVDNVTLLLGPYKEEEDIVIFRVKEKEIEEAFLEMTQIKKQLKRERKRSEFILYFRCHPSIKS